MQREKGTVLNRALVAVEPQESGVSPVSGSNDAKAFADGYRLAFDAYPDTTPFECAAYTWDMACAFSIGCKAGLADAENFWGKIADQDAQAYADAHEYPYHNCW